MSVLLPIRNGIPHLDEAARSLSDQTFRDFEIVAVDDGSTDGTWQTLQAWSRSDERVRVVRQPAVGLVPALEAGRALARGRYLARMDADDRAAPERFALQFEHMENAPSVALTGAHVRYFPIELVRDGARRYQAWLNGMNDSSDLLRDVFVECPLAHPTFFMRADAVEAVGGYQDREWPEDYDLLLRLWEAGWGLDVVPRVLHHWREGPERHSRVSAAYSPDAFRRCKIHYLKRTLLSTGRPVVIWGAGPTGKAFGRRLIAAGCTLLAWVDLDPRKIGQTIHGAPVVSHEEAASLPASVVLSAVGSSKGRRLVRNAFRDMGLKEHENAVVVA